MTAPCPSEAEMFRELSEAGWECRSVTWFRAPDPEEIAEDAGPGKLSGFYFFSNESAWKDLKGAE